MKERVNIMSEIPLGLSLYQPLLQVLLMVVYEAWVLFKRDRTLYITSALIFSNFYGWLTSAYYFYIMY